jgi:CO/xanthine dehydrogenase Mo-binding subunit
VCVGAAEVEVDGETGRLRVRRLASAADVGKAINPQLVEAQDEGGSLQGLGNAVFEEMIFEQGQLLNGSLIDYHVPTFDDAPDAFESVIVENGDGPGPYGAKGVGEGSLACVPGAIVNALGDLGIDTRELPLTPERVWRLIRGAGGAPRPTKRTLP